MPPDVAAIRTYFAKLGLEPEIADMYLALHAHGPQTISALARNSGVERTRIYRLIDRLIETNLIELEARGKRGTIKAAPIANLHILINQREQELRSLQDELELIEQVLARNSLSTPAVRVQAYYGVHGIQQMLRNTLDANDTILVYGNRSFEEIAGAPFMDTWAREFEQRSLHARLLIDEAFIGSWQKSKNTRSHIKGIVHSSIDPKHLALASPTILYNDTVGYIHQKDSEVYGIVLYNKEIAAAQRQLFALAWEKSTPWNNV